MKIKNLIFYIFFITVYAYEFSKTQQITNAYNNHYTVLQYIGVLMVGVGFALFYVSRRLFTSISARKGILMFFNVVYSVGMIYMMSVPDRSYITWIIHISLGYLGAMVYYYIAGALGRTDYIGRVAMVGHSLSVLLQMLVPERVNNTGVMLVVLIIGFVMVTYLMLFPPADWMFEEMLPYAEETPSWNKEIKLRLSELLIIVVLADALGCLVETTWTMVWEKGIVDMYTYPRLFMIAGHIIAGFFADYKKHRYFDTALLVVLALGFAGVYMHGHEAAGLCIFYLLAGFIILYVNIRFWQIAPYTNKPELWAGFGRILFIYEGALSELFIRFVADEPFYCMILLYLFYAVVVYYVMKESRYKTLKEYAFDEKISNAASALVMNPMDIVGGIDTSMNQKYHGNDILCGKEYEGQEKKNDDRLASKNVCRDESTIEQKPDYPTSPQEREELERKRFIAYALRHDLTPRESDVLQVLLNSDATMKEIAETLNISERMLYNYMKQLYEKLGAENRAGLVRAYYEGTRI